MERPLTLEGPCLDCTGAIPEEELAREQLSPEERRAQAYVDGAIGAEVEEPSVITLNSIATSLAAMATGLMPPASELDASAYYPQERELRARTAPTRPECRFCGEGERSVLARGDLKALSLKPGRARRGPPLVRRPTRGDSAGSGRRCWAGDGCRLAAVADLKGVCC